MRVVISSGHGKYIRGASGYLDEVDEARRVVERVAEFLRGAGVEVETFHDDTSTTQSENLDTIVDYHNSQTRDLDVSVHFNAYETTSQPMGTEVLYVTQFTLADQLSTAISEAADLPNRGPKKRTDLAFLNGTEMPAVLLETAFVDSSVDADHYRDQFEAICVAIAEEISGQDVDPDEQPPELPELPPPEVTSDNRIDIVGSVHGDIAVRVNGQLLRGAIGGGRNLVDLQISATGDVVVTLNGQDLHSGPSIPSNQCEITASVFGGSSDHNTSAYDENKVLNDTDLYVALPDRFEGDRPLVRVFNRATGENAEAAIWDVGPWNTDDPYWNTGTRPQAESGTDTSGRETNGAGIDLSPALAKAIGIDGMGKVDWEFV